MYQIVVRHAEKTDFEAIQRIFTFPAVYRNMLQLPHLRLHKWQKHLDPETRPEGQYQLGGLY